MLKYDESQSHRVQLTVQAPNPATEIFVIDGHFKVVASGLGSLETSLPPGLYKVKFKAGEISETVRAVLTSDKNTVHIEGPHLAISSSIPLIQTRTTREAHRDHANRLSQAAHHTGSQDSGELFIFVRDLESRSKTKTMLGLTLHQADGTQVFNLAEECDYSIEEQWGGCNLSLEPGQYRLRLDTETQGILEQMLVVSAGWQTQTFMLRHSYVRHDQEKQNKQVTRRADLANAAVLMTRMGTGGFDPMRPDLYYTELAHKGLVNGRAVVSDKELREIIEERDSASNPMLGILGGHLLLLSAKPNTQLLRQVIDNVRQLIGPHPDVDALEIQLANLEGHSTEDLPTFSYPPMLRSSWEIIIRSSATDANRVPLRSLASHIWDKVWGSGAWLVWQKPDDDALTKSASMALGADPLKDIADIAGTWTREELGQKLASLKLDTLQENVLRYVSQHAHVGSQGLESTPLSSGELMTKVVQQLQIPSAAVRQVTTDLLSKVYKLRQDEEMSQSTRE